MTDPAIPVRILVVEDEPADVRLLEEALREVARPVQTERVTTGDAALERLRAGPGAGGAIPLPDLVFLDLNLPRVDGRAVLAAIRSDPKLRSLLVVVVTASPVDADVLTAYDLRADGYLRKPVTGEAIRTLLARLLGPAPAAAVAASVKSPPPAT